jgi:hypothetical protein
MRCGDGNEHQATHCDGTSECVSQRGGVDVRGNPWTAPVAPAPGNHDEQTSGSIPPKKPAIRAWHFPTSRPLVLQRSLKHVRML